jgi:hypothetical protein
LRKSGGKRNLALGLLKNSGRQRSYIMPKKRIFPTLSGKLSAITKRFCRHCLQNYHGPIFAGNGDD